MRLDEIRKRLEAAKGKEVVMDFPLHVDAAVRVAVIHGTSDLYWLLARVEKLEGLLARLIDDKPCSICYSGNCVVYKYGPPCPVAEARTLLAGEESKNDN